MLRKKAVISADGNVLIIQTRGIYISFRKYLRILPPAEFCSRKVNNKYIILYFSFEDSVQSGPVSDWCCRLVESHSFELPVHLAYNQSSTAAGGKPILADASLNNKQDKRRVTKPQYVAGEGKIKV